MSAEQPQNAGRRAEIVPPAAGAAIAPKEKSEKECT